MYNLRYNYWQKVVFNYVAFINNIISNNSCGLSRTGIKINKSIQRKNQLFLLI